MCCVCVYSGNGHLFSLYQLSHPHPSPSPTELKKTELGMKEYTKEVYGDSEISTLVQTRFNIAIIVLQDIYIVYTDKISLRVIKYPEPLQTIIIHL